MPPFRKLSDEEYAVLVKSAADWDEKNPNGTNPYGKVATEEDTLQAENDFYETFLPQYPEYI